MNMSPIARSQHHGVGKNILAFVVAANRNQYLAYHRDYSLEQAVDEAFFVDPDRFRRWYSRKSRHGHNLAADNHHKTGVGGKTHFTNRQRRN